MVSLKDRRDKAIYVALRKESSGRIKVAASANSTGMVN